MRVWHKGLIPVLPRLQLLSQWRECCLIAKSIKEKGTPNHILVNKIMDYPIEHFIGYTWLVRQEMLNRNYKCDGSKFTQYFDEFEAFTIYPSEIFDKWHDERYLRQCLFNLEEKAMCGAIPDNEWNKIVCEYVFYDLWRK